jgi:hypothetical protein
LYSTNKLPFPVPGRLPARVYAKKISISQNFYRRENLVHEIHERHEREKTKNFVSNLENFILCHAWSGLLLGAWLFRIASLQEFCFYFVFFVRFVVKVFLCVSAVNAFNQQPGGRTGGW